MRGAEQIPVSVIGHRIFPRAKPFKHQSKKPKICLITSNKELDYPFIDDDEKCAELATLEWMCRNVLEWEYMKCMQK